MSVTARGFKPDTSSYIGNNPCSEESSEVWHQSWGTPWRAPHCRLVWRPSPGMFGAWAHLLRLLCSCPGLLMRRQVTEHTVPVATHPIWEDVTVSRRPYHFVLIFVSLFWVPASLVASSDLARTVVAVVFTHWWPCSIVGTKVNGFSVIQKEPYFFLIENSVICR